MNKQHIIIPIVMLAMLVACSVPTSATWGDVPLSDHARSVVWENVTSSALYIGYTGGINPEQYTYHFDVPSGTEVRTQLCTDVWSADSCGQMDFEFNGCGQGCAGDFPFGTYQFGTSGGGCGDLVCDEHQNVAGNGCGGNGVWWNVTGLVTSGATNDFVANRNTTECTMDGRKRGANLVHLYNDASGDTLYVWFNQGMEDDPVPDTHIYNVNAGVATEWTLYVCIDTGDDGDTVTFNGHTFTWSAPNHWMDINSYDVTADVVSGTNTIEWYSTDEYFHPFWTILVGHMPGGIPQPDLTVTEIDAEMLRPGINQQVSATILNQGDAGTGTAFDVSLVVDGGTPDIVTGVGPLGPGASTPVSFTVNLAEGCHNFTVIADCNNDVTNESNENNNAKSENHQVGYVIVVRSNSDFDDLVTEGLAWTDGTTYYIEDLTIENCAGTGITIENTNDPFVIKNCTVYDCQNDGVYFHDLTNGRIDNSTVMDNPGKGIRVKNSTYVDIKDNDVFNNTGYGIEVYPRTLGVPEYVSDCQFVNIHNNTARENFYGIEVIGYNCTVKHNTARNNSWYGIYVYGKYNEIQYNDIKYNDDYGVKIFNSTDCSICWNNFVDNNLDFPARTSQSSDNRNNHWNTTVPTTNYTGNYWSDYTGSDNNNDGIGDTPYPIADGTANDYYPLMNLVGCGDVNCDGGINFGDVVAVRNHFFYGVQLCNPWAGDVNCDGSINFGDVVAVRNHFFYGVSLNCCKDC